MYPAVDRKAAPEIRLGLPSSIRACLFDLDGVNCSVPTAARDALCWRPATLAAARKHARELGLAGAAFPWRTIHGAGTAAFRVNVDMADAVVRHVDATGDETFERDIGVELLVETARLWRSLGHHALQGRFRIDGVTGPDEYSAMLGSIAERVMHAANCSVLLTRR